MERNYNIEYGFNLDYAVKYGVDESIMIKNFQFWIMKNKANEKNFHDGRTWTFNSKKAFVEIFPFWTEKQIRRILDSLIQKNILITGNYNKMSYDRTLWYAFKDNTICPNSLIEQTEQSDQIDQTVAPIPDNKPDNKPDKIKPEILQNYLSIAKSFYRIICDKASINNVLPKKPNFENWSNDIRKMIEIDKRNETIIKEIMSWIVNDDFEKTVVRCPSKLRERFDVLCLKMEKDREKKNKINDNVFI